MKYCVSTSIIKVMACSAVSVISFLWCFRETIKKEFSTKRSKEGMSVSSRNKWADVPFPND